MYNNKPLLFNFKFMVDEKNTLKEVMNYFGYNFGYLSGILDRKDISDSEKVVLAKKALSDIGKEVGFKK